MQKESIVDAETMTNNMFTNSIDHFEQLVMVVEQWRQTLGDGHERATPFVSEVEDHFGKLPQIYKIALESEIRRRVCGARWSAGCGTFAGPKHTICKAKVAEFCGARALKPVETRAKVGRGEQVHDPGPKVLRARPRGARALDGAIDGVSSARVARGNT